MPRCQPPETARERLREWYRQVPGSLLLEAERCAVHGVLSELMGYRVAQVGSLGNDNLLCKSRMPHRMILDADGHSQGVAADLYARADALPLQSSSLDAMLLPHTLEFEDDPHQVLREAHRALIAEGHVIILGFNPWGLWGLWRLAFPGM